MTSQHLLNHDGLGERPEIGGPTDWNTWVVSKEPVREESFSNPTESQTKGRHSALMAFWIFLALLIMLSSAAMYLLWAKLSGSL